MPDDPTGPRRVWRRRGARLRARLRARLWERLWERLGPGPRRAVLLGVRSAREFVEDDCPQLAAAVSYHVLLSVFPLVMVVVAGFGLVADHRAVQEHVLSLVTTYIPLSEHGQQSLRDLVGQLQGGAAALGLFGILGLVISASGMMTSIRRALTLAWDADLRRSFVRGKLLDFALVALAAVMLGASLGLTVAVRVADVAGWLVGFAVPLLLAFVLFCFFYVVVPAVRTRLAEVWRGALVGAVLFQLMKEGFALYLDHFANYNAVYGSLGAAAAFIFFVYLSANAFLFGAEVASEYPRLP